MNLLAIFLVAQTAKHPPVLVPDVAIYTQKPSKRTVNVLKLYPDNTYNFCRYKATRIQRDTGTFKGKHRKLTFLSTERRHSFNPLTQKPVLKGKKGIYLKPMRGRIGGKPDFLISKNPQEYNKPWNYNPITKRLEEELVEVKPSATSSASTQIAIEAAKRYYLNTTAQYTHGYNTILENNYSGPGLYSTYINGIFVTWDEDTSDAKLFGDLNTVVHESVHTYNNNHYLIIPGITIPVNETETCHSSDFNILVSKDLQQKIFRWNNYVSKESGVTANLMGIYGIMDEFSAYMNGTRAGLMAAAKLEAQGNHQKADIQLEHASRTYFAWYELRL